MIFLLFKVFIGRQLLCCWYFVSTFLYFGNFTAIQAYSE